MKSPLLAALATLATIGCAEQQRASLSALGPETAPIVQKSSTGTLVVYSAWRRTGTDDPDHRVHGDYQVLTPESKPFLRVRNYITPMLEDPANIPLAPGNYLIKARVQGFGFVSVPVTIESHKTTALYMDNTTQPDAQSRANVQQVQLADGRVIGWSSASRP